MRIVAATLTGLLLGGTLLLGQQVPQVAVPQQPEPGADPKLEAALANWEKSMAGISTFHIECSRVKVNKVFSTTEDFTGVACYQKPNKALLQLANKKQPAEFEKFIINNLTFYQWVPANKVVQVHQLPPPQNGQMADDNFLAFITGMKSADAKKRYVLKMIPPPAGDTWYHYIEVLPRNNQDKADFSRARLVLTIATGLPRQLWFQESNGNEVTWDFGKILLNVQLPAGIFDRPATLEPGWKLQPMVAQPAGPPRVVRPQGG